MKLFLRLVRFWVDAKDQSCDITVIDVAVDLQKQIKHFVIPYIRHQVGIIVPDL